MTQCEKAYRGAPFKAAFDCPGSLVEMDFCPLSGRALNEYCTDPVHGHPAARGWFIRGTEPQEPCTLHEEPPILIHPEDPSDPDRIPLLPDDLLPEVDPLLPVPPSDSDTPWYNRWFSFFHAADR